MTAGTALERADPCRPWRSRSADDPGDPLRLSHGRFWDARRSWSRPHATLPACAADVAIVVTGFCSPLVGRDDGRNRRSARCAFPGPRAEALGVDVVLVSRSLRHAAAGGWLRPLGIGPRAVHEMPIEDARRETATLPASDRWCEDVLCRTGAWGLRIWSRSSGPVRAIRSVSLVKQSRSGRARRRDSASEVPLERSQPLPQHARRADRRLDGQEPNNCSNLDRAADGHGSGRSASATAATKSAWDRLPGRRLSRRLGTPEAGGSPVVSKCWPHAAGRGERLGCVRLGIGNRVLRGAAAEAALWDAASQGELIRTLVDRGRRGQRRHRRTYRDRRRT